MKNLLNRLLTALVAVPLILALIYLAPWWGWGLFACVAMIIASIEFFEWTHGKDKVGRAMGTGLSLAVFASLLLTNFGNEHGPMVVLALVGVAPVALLFTLFRPLDHGTALTRMSALVMGPLFLGGAFAAVSALRRIGTDHVGSGLVILTLMSAWFSDTFGYFFGKGLGGPKLYPSVSPGKTWAGSLGGLLGAALGAVLAHFWYMPELPLLPGIALAIVAGGVGQMGDLCESLMKRAVGVKDSGAILPGHGGILDRVDAMLFCAVVIFAAVQSGAVALVR